MMKIALFLIISLVISCQPSTKDPIRSYNPSTEFEEFDASAPNSSTLIQSMVIYPASSDPAIQSNHFEYKYLYNTKNQLVKLDCQAHAHNHTLPSNLSHRVVTLSYAPSGELEVIRMSNYNPQGQSTNYDLSFRFRKEGSDLVTYGQPQWYPNPFASQPILRIDSSGRLRQMPKPWNGQPNTQFALNTFEYEPNGNLRDILFSYVDPKMISRQTSLLSKLKSAQYVINPFGRNPAYGVAHFLIHGGYDITYTMDWISVGRMMLLSHQAQLWAMDENSISFRAVGQRQTLYRYRYDANRLPVCVIRKQLTGDQVYSDSVRFVY